MKALMLNQYYSSRTQILIYTALSIVIAIFFTGFGNNTISAAIFACMYPTIGATDYLKKESASGWVKYAITMPIKRKTIVDSHFLIHLILVILGFVVSVSVISIFKVSFIAGLSASFIGSGFALQLTLLYLLTYKFGSENSNGIYFLGMLMIFIVFVIGIMISAFTQNNNIVFLSGLAMNAYYCIFSIVVALIIYYLSVRHFEKTDF